MAQFTPAQTAEIVNAVAGQCEAIDRTNAWSYNFGPELPGRRGRAILDLCQRAASSVGALLADCPPLDKAEIMRLVLNVVEGYDRKNGIPAAY